MADYQDWQEASRAVARGYFPHRLRPVGIGASPAGVRFGSIDLGPVKVAHLAWGAPVQVDSSHEGAIAVNLPVTGALVSEIRGQAHAATPACATVYPANEPVRILEWDADCEIIGVRIDVEHFHREAARLLLDLPPTLGALAIRGPGNSDWVKLVRTITSCSLEHPLVREQLAGTITTAVLMAAVPDGAPERRVVGPRPIKLLAQRIRCEPERAWSAAEMAEVAGTSVRRLQEAFRQHLGTTPTAFLRDARLERVRQQLEAPGPGTTVTEVALANGVLHLGRFAGAYRRRYGELPSETLARVMRQ